MSPLDQPCPTCKALTDKPCKTPKGKWTAPHAARRGKPAGHAPAPSKIITNPEIIELICADVAQGVPVTHAARAHGVPKPTLMRWLVLSELDDEDHAPHRYLRDRLEHAHAEAAVRHVGIINRAAEGGYVTKQVTRTLRDGSQEEETTYAPMDWRGSAFLLERTMPRDFARRQSIELTSSGDGLVENTETGPAGVLDSAGIDRLRDRLLAFREQKAVTAGDDGITDAEVVE